MKIHLSVVVGILTVVSALTLYAVEHPGAEHPKAPAAEKPAMPAQNVYVCPDYETMALKAGKCEKCGKGMVQKHVLGTNDGKAMLCDCEASCTCDPTAMKDGKCGCGKEVKAMSCKGMYAGPMGCPEISDKAGKCACGMKMNKCE